MLTDQRNDTLAGDMRPLANPDVFNLPIKSMVSRAANSIDSDQTEPTMFAQNISKMFQQKTKQTNFIVISVFSALEILFICNLNVMLFSEKYADPGEMRHGNFSVFSLFCRPFLLP